MSDYQKKCKKCKGQGVVDLEECNQCEGLGMQLFTITEEEYNDAVELTGDKVFTDQSNFIDLEEEDYEV